MKLASYKNKKWHDLYYGFFTGDIATLIVKKN
jgi:hypothetical protein